MLPPKDFDFPPAGAHTLNHAIHLVRLPARFAHFRDHDIGVEAAVGPGGKLEVAVLVSDRLHANEHVLLRMVEPVAGAPRADHALELVRLHPHDFVHARIAPDAETFAPDLHRAAGDPKEEEAFVLKRWDRHRAHFVIRHGTIW